MHRSRELLCPSVLGALHFLLIWISLSGAHSVIQIKLQVIRHFDDAILFQEI